MRTFLLRLLPTNKSCNIIIFRSLFFFSFTALLQLSADSNGQDLLNSRTSSYYTYIFKIKDKEAKKIYKKDLWKVDSSYFHTLVDSIPTDSIYRRKLSQGHYLKVFAKENKLQISIMTVHGFDVKILNNNTDLNIQIFDSLGNSINDAKVVLGSKRLRFDKHSNTYRDKKSNRQGILKITHNGLTSYYSLDREYNNSQFKRISGKILYSVPIKYVWIPVRFIIFIPIDGVKSLVHWNTTGSIWHIKNFFVKTYHKVVCLFDDYHCYNEYRFTNDHGGYLVFNKPKYQPGDTVKFKAFIVNKKGKPIKDDIEVMLDRYGKQTKLTQLWPYRKGAFEYQFTLNDSLDLLLDTRLGLELRKKEDKVYLSEYFRYEDYELSSVNLNIRTSSDKHYLGKEFILFAEGKDENDLNLLDANLEVLVHAKNHTHFYDTSVFVPDTLYYKEVKLEPKGESEIVLPDSIFPRADLVYEIQARLSTSDFDVVNESKTIQYYHKKMEVDYVLKTDSLQLTYKINDIETEIPAQIFAVDGFGNQTKMSVSKLPTKIKVNPYYPEYLVKVDSLSETISVASESAMIQCFTERTSDSVHVVISNPRKLLFNYFIYKKNKELKRGYGKELEFHDKCTSRQNYYVSLQYLWAGKIKDANYKIPLNTGELKIEIDQQPVIYPGQKTEVEITVTDFKGNPVPDVDLTAFSITNKFNADPPQIPDLEKKPKDKEIINNFRFRDFENDEAGVHLDYDTWKVLAGLDSIEHYKFRYPEQQIYQTSYSVDDSVTQFAPFVFFDGYVELIHVVYVDYKPVYFRWSDNPQPYSFRLDSGYHKIELRTDSKLIELSKVYFPEGKKTIISLDLYKNYPNVKMWDADPKLSDRERRNLYKYIFPYQKISGSKYAYVKQGDNVQLLTGGSSYKINMLAGPVEGRGLTFQIIDGYSTYFQHEPMFEYEFSKSLLKMRQFNVDQSYPLRLSGWSQNLALRDEVLTEEKILRQWQENLEQKRNSQATYSNPYRSKPGTGTLSVDYEIKVKGYVIPLNILIFKYDDPEFIRVYPGSSSRFYALDEGRYKLIYFYPGSRYYSYDSIFIKADGLNYRRLKEADEKLKDEFSTKASRIIEETIFRPIKKGSYEEKAELNRIKREHERQFTFYGIGDIIFGYVYEKGEGPLPGVNVIAKGTNIGTVTDIDGYFTFKVPANVGTIVFSSVGYITEEINISTGNFDKVELQADITALREIVVTGYASMRKSNITASVSTINSGAPGSIDFMNQLQGRVAGVTVLPSGETTVRIRGVSSVNFDQEPLYVIDGVIYTGDINELKPEFIDNIQVLKDESATAIYGARAANGVVIISTKENTFEAVGQKIGEGVEEEFSLVGYDDAANSLRTNFSDYGYWEPRLTTDVQGKASFSVTFPDDVTSWESYVLAMNDKRQSGMKSDQIKSFKPLMAQLAVPRFAIAGDSINAIGKILNYTPDTLRLVSSFELNDGIPVTEEKVCTTSVIDTLSIFASSKDSINVKYSIETKSGYFDGEQRNIPVYPLGMEETVGSFYVLDQDTTINLAFDAKLGKVTMYAQSDILEVLNEEIEHVRMYKYDCNEQLASKLKVLLAQKVLYEYQDKKQQSDRQINLIINKLLKNRSDDGLWGWWGNSRFTPWISLHVLEALLEARKHGYDIKMKEEDIFDFLFWKVSEEASHIDKIRITKMLKLTSYEVDCNQFIKDIDPRELKNLNQYMEYIALNLQCGIDLDLDTLNSYAKETMMGNLYYSDSTRHRNLLYNDIQNTFLAYEILKYDSVKNQSKLRKIRNYFLEKRNRGYWSNTYESARIIETILPDILGGSSEVQKSQLTISGAINKTVSEFPFELELEGSDSISVSKTGDYPVYFTAHQSFWNEDPGVKTEEFEIQSVFENQDSLQTLETGKEVKLILDLKVKKDAEYVMIEVPFPASCSYASKEINSLVEEHREYFRNKTSIFCEFLREGTYRFEIDLLPRYSGKYHLNPAKAELMYFPTFYGNNEIRKVIVE